MLTVRFKQLGLTPGDLVLDAGAGFGRHDGDGGGSPAQARSMTIVSCIVSAG